MGYLFHRHHRLLALLSVLALVSTACNNDKIASLYNQTVNATVPASPDASTPKQPTAKHSAVLAQEQKARADTPNTYERAIDTATGAITISQSAINRNDWSLVANQWQKAINLLKSVPTWSSHYRTAQKKLIEYQSYLADARLRATPPSAKPCSGDTKSSIFLRAD